MCQSDVHGLGSKKKQNIWTAEKCDYVQADHNFEKPKATEHETMDVHKTTELQVAGEREQNELSLFESARNITTITKWITNSLLLSVLTTNIWKLWQPAAEVGA